MNGNTILEIILFAFISGRRATQLSIDCDIDVCIVWVCQFRIDSDSDRRNRGNGAIEAFGDSQIWHQIDDSGIDSGIYDGYDSRCIDIARPSSTRRRMRTA